MQKIVETLGGSEYEIPAIFPTFSRVMEIRYRALEGGEKKKKEEKLNKTKS